MYKCRRWSPSNHESRLHPNLTSHNQLRRISFSYLDPRVCPPPPVAAVPLLGPRFVCCKIQISRRSLSHLHRALTTQARWLVELTSYQACNNTPPRQKSSCQKSRRRRHSPTLRSRISRRASRRRASRPVGRSGLRAHGRRLAALLSSRMMRWVWRRRVGGWCC